MFLSVFNRKRPSMFMAKTFLDLKKRKIIILLDKRHQQKEQATIKKRRHKKGKTITLKAGSDLISIMVRTVSCKIELPAFLVVSVLVHTFREETIIYT